MRKLQKDPHIFLGLREMAGFMRGLQSGFTAIGIKTHFLDLGGSPFQYQSATNSPLLNKINRVIGKAASFFFRNLGTRMLWLGIFQNLISVFFFPWALFCHDVFIFCSNSTFFFYLELPILKLFRKKIFFILLGTESRPVYCSGKIKMNSTMQVFLVKQIGKLQKAWIRYIEFFSDCLISIPPQALFHEKPFVSIMTTGYPVECRLPETSASLPAKRKFRILHAPSHSSSKGTEVFRRILDELRQEGLDFEYIEISGVSNQRVLQEISCSDLIIDELYSDTPLGGIATEAAFFGKPSLIGSYYADILHEDAPPEKIPPSFFVQPERIKDTLRDLIRHPVICEQKGALAKDFLSRNWTPVSVAARFLQIISGDIPQDWFFEPAKCSYFGGCGISREQLKNNISKITGGKNGMKNLCLEDKRSLKKKITDFLNEK